MALLITGAAGDIGIASTRAMLGVTDVVLADIDESRVLTISEQLNESNISSYKAYGIYVDVTSSKAVDEMFSYIEQSVGDITMLFNNAGLNRRAPIEKVTEEDWDLIMNVHVKGTYLCSKKVLPKMCERKQGVIVNMSSDYAVMAKPNVVAYSVAKAAVYSLTKSLAREFAPYNVRVNALGPGPIDTALLRSNRTDEEWKRAKLEYIEGVPMKRIGKPEEVANVLKFLLSDRSSYITGQMIHPNGGQQVS